MTSGHENGIENANQLLLYTYMISTYRKGYLWRACFEAETLEETIESGPVCITDLRLAYRKRLKNKKIPTQKYFFFTFFLCNFSVRTLQGFQFFFFFF